MKTPTIFQWYQILRQNYQIASVPGGAGRSMVGALVLFALCAARPGSRRSRSA